jgi:nitroreductase
MTSQSAQAAGVKPVKSADEIIKPLEWRYATKKFDPAARVDEKTFAILEEALRLSASSFGLQPWKFVIVTDQAKKAELLGACFNQHQVVDCSHLVVISRVANLDKAYVEHYLQTIAKARGVARESLDDYAGRMFGYVENQPAEKIAQWTANQCYIALGYLLSTSAALGIDACPMEGFDKDRVDAILDLPAKGCKSVVMCPVGHRSEDDKYAQATKVRFPASELFIRI